MVNRFNRIIESKGTNYNRSVIGLNVEQEKETTSENSRQELLRNMERTQYEKQTAIQEMMSNVENIMEENNRLNFEVKNVNDELKATKVLYEDLKVEKEDVIQKMDKALEECELSGKQAVEKLRNEHQSQVDTMVKDHSNIVDDLKRSKVEAIELVKKQHVKRMSDVLAAKDEEHKQEIDERDNKLKMMTQNEEMMKASYSEKVNVYNVNCHAWTLYLLCNINVMVCMFYP